MGLKGAHALLLCRMEEGKVDWHMTEKIDRIRRAHAQKVVTNPSSQGKKSQINGQGTPCKFFQTGKCSHTSDHVTNGHSYKHICSHCFGVGKPFPHPQKDCRNAKKGQDAKKRVRHCHHAVPIEKVNKGHMGQGVESKTQDKLPTKKYNTKIVSTSHAFNGVSTNWKLDVYKYKNYSYAQVVKCRTVRGSLVMPIMATIGTFPTQGKCVQNNDMRQYRDKKNSHKSSKIHALATHSSQSLKHAKGDTCKKVAYKVKVSVPKNDIKCTNRFHILQESDDVVSEPLGDLVSTSSGGIEHITDPCSNMHIKANNTSHFDVHDTLTPKYFKGQVDKNDNPSSHQGVGSHKDTEIQHDGQMATKYYLDLHLTAKKTYKEFLPTCQTLQHWEAHTKFKFDFIPLGDLKLLSVVSPKQTSLDPLQLHQKIKKSGEHNYLQSQFTVDSQLKPEVWEKLLQGYWDGQLPLLICFGFPLDFDRRAPL